MQFSFTFQEKLLLFELLLSVPFDVFRDFEKVRTFKIIENLTGIQVRNRQVDTSKVVRSTDIFRSN